MLRYVLQQICLFNKNLTKIGISEKKHLNKQILPGVTKYGKRDGRRYNSTVCGKWGDRYPSDQ